MEAERSWLNVGAAYTDEESRPGIEAEIQSLEWQKPTGTFAMSPGLALKEIIEQLEIPKVSAVAISRQGMILGVEGNYTDARVRLYVIDTGTKLIPIATDLWRKAA